MKTTTIIIFTLITCCFSLFSREIPDSIKFRSLEPNEFHLQYLKNDSALLIDVREFFEYRHSRIIGSVNIPSSGNLEISTDTINKTYSLFFYCYSGTRSERVARFFYDKGFRKLYSLEGGFVRWNKEKMQVEKRRKGKKKLTFVPKL